MDLVAARCGSRGSYFVGEYAANATATAKSARNSAKVRMQTCASAGVNYLCSAGAEFTLHEKSCSKTVTLRLSESRGELLILENEKSVLINNINFGINSCPSELII